MIHRQLPTVSPRSARIRRLALGASATVLAVGLAACGSSSKTSSATTSSTTAAGSGTTIPRGTGSVKVLYAGSLVDLMNNQVGPGFKTATGYTFTGTSGDSGSLATDIKGKVDQGDVFISASPTVDTELEGAANGNWVNWYASFSTSSLVLGYNPKSKFAADLTSKPWYTVLSEPGIQIGRTDPATDPKGKLTAQALTTAETADNATGLKAVGSSTSNIYTEDTLVGRLQAGQLDVGFFYAAEAKAAHIPTVPLTGIDLKATYTITILNQAPNEKGAEAFVQYLLGSAGAPALKADGFDPIDPPQVSGTGVPAALNGVIPTS